ncbi:MAG: PspC family transcriptional regulator [Saprospiraceae bacterium]|nr:PspC family transcriptional regulator [Saprospiraceae bacterium]MBP9193882.1 PspC family transcriptional regulator [Saprospiraceae bacterium]
MNLVKEISEKFGFGVCNYLSAKVGIHASRVRLYFIYLSFVTFGSPIFIYLILAFWVNVKKYVRDYFSLSQH